MSSAFKTDAEGRIVSPDKNARIVPTAAPYRQNIQDARRAFNVTQYLLNDGKITPLEVMVEAMRKSYKEKDLEKAVAIAQLAAPYMHPKLSAIQASVQHQQLDKDGNPTDPEKVNILAIAASKLSTDELKVMAMLHEKMGLTLEGTMEEEDA